MSSPLSPRPGAPRVLSSSHMATPGHEEITHYAQLAEEKLASQEEERAKRVEEAKKRVLARKQAQLKEQDKGSEKKESPVTVLSAVEEAEQRRLREVDERLRLEEEQRRSEAERDLARKEQELRVEEERRLEEERRFLEERAAHEDAERKARDEEERKLREAADAERKRAAESTLDEQQAVRRLVHALMIGCHADGYDRPR